MKIAHVIPQLVKGGAEKMAVDLANHFAAQGDEVAMLAAYPADPGLLQWALSDAVDIRVVSERAGRWSAYALLVPWIVRNRLWLESRDIIHCHLSFGSALGTAVSALQAVRGRRGPRIVETYHAIGAPISSLDRRVHALLAATHDGVVAMAEDEPWARFVGDHPDICTAMIPNGIALDIKPPSAADSSAYRARAGIPPGAPVIGTVGRLVPARRPDAFLEVFRNVAEALPDVHFLMAGEGPEAERLKAVAAQSGLGDRLHFPGLAVRPELPFSIIDLYLTLNVGPITGIAALEAAAMGLPLVAVQANAGHRPGAQDWIFSSTDPAAIAAEAVRLLNSPAERQALAERQKQHVVANHSVEAMAAAYRAFYERVLESP